jgi:hypothetical protein
VPYVLEIASTRRACSRSASRSRPSYLRPAPAPRVRASTRSRRSGGRAPGKGKRSRLNGAFVSRAGRGVARTAGGRRLLRSFRNLQRGGLSPRTSSSAACRSRPALKTRRRRSFFRLRGRVRALPGVKSAGLASIAPFSNSDRGNLPIKGREPAPGQPELVARFRAGAPCRRRPHSARARTRARRDRHGDEPPGRRRGRDARPPLLGGRRRPRPGDPARRRQEHEAVDADRRRRQDRQTRRSDGRGDTPRLHSDGTVERPLHGPGDRTTSDPAALTRSVRSQVQAMDRSLPFYDVHTSRPRSPAPSPPAASPTSSCSPSR